MKIVLRKKPAEPSPSRMTALQSILRSAAPSVKVSELPAATSLDGSEVSVVVQGGATKKVDVDLLAGLFSGSVGQGQVTGLADALAAKVGTGDARLTDARTPLAHAASHGSGGSDPVTVAQSQVAGLSEALSVLSDAVAARLALTGGTLTGPLVLSGDPTLANHAASMQWVQSQVAALADSAPDLLNTLNELAAAIGDDPNFATTVANNIAAKANANASNVSGNASDWRTALGLGTAATTASTDYASSGHAHPHDHTGTYSESGHTHGSSALDLAQHMAFGG